MKRQKECKREDKIKLKIMKVGKISTKQEKHGRLTEILHFKSSIYM